MKVWKIKNQNDVKLVEFTSPRKEGEIKVKVSKALISPSDILALSTDSDHILTPSHSAIGYVSESDNELYRFGSRVILSPFVLKEEGEKKKVDVMGVNIDGFLQDFMNLNEDNVFVLPEGIPVTDEEALFAEYIATGIKTIDSFEYEKGDFVIVAGAGTLGLIISQLAIYYQLVPILIDLDAAKLELAKKWGVYYTLNPTFDDLDKSINNITGGRKCDTAIIAGRGVALNTVPYLIKDEGEVIICGYAFRAKNQIDTGVILNKQLKIIGVNNGYGEIPTAINLLANKIIKTDGIIEKKIDFKDLPTIIDDSINYPYQFNKILVDFD